MADVQKNVLLKLGCVLKCLITLPNYVSPIAIAQCTPHWANARCGGVQKCCGGLTFGETRKGGRYGTI